MACFITGMIAASHIGSTSATNAENSPRVASRQDDSSQSFSDHLGAAAKSAHGTSHDDRASQSDAASKRGKSSLSSPKSDLKRIENTDEIAAAPQQQAEADQAPRTLTLPIQLTLSAGASDDTLPAGGQASAEVMTTASLQDAQSQGAMWVGLNGQAAWTPRDPSLTQGASSTTWQPGEGAIAVQGEDGAKSIAVTSGQNASLTNSASKAGGDDSQVKRSDATETIQSSPVDTGNPASTPVLLSQASDPSSLTPVAVDASMLTLSSGVNVAGISAIKASAAFKGLQNSIVNQKSTNSLTNTPVAGAKETDSYLSIQKEAKNDGIESKDSAMTAVQHNAHSEVVQQSLAAPVVTSPQANAAAIASAHQQSFPAALGKSQESASQGAQTPAAATHPDSSAAASEAPASALASAVVNSAKLLQSIGQSEMRVGMRTADFGDISIRTSSTRDSISAQISLGHDDLAKTLTAHMPEMQTRLASGEVVDVHIQNNAQSNDFNGSFGSANQNGSSGQAQEDRPDSTTFAKTYSPDQTAVGGVSASLIAAAAASTGRLDIRA